MNRGKTQSFVVAVAAAAALISGACSSGSAKGKEPSAPAPALAVAAAGATERPIARFIRATGSLMAEEQAGVAAETARRLVAPDTQRSAAAAQRAAPNR